MSTADATSPTVAIARAAVDAIAAHAREEAPNECCGLLVGTPGVIDESVRTANLYASPARFQVDPAEHVALRRRLRGTERSILGAYHSHVRGPAAPSPSDLAEAHYPEFVNVIVSLEGEKPEMRAYRISGGEFAEIRLVIVSSARRRRGDRDGS